MVNMAELTRSIAAIRNYQEDMKSLVSNANDFMKLMILAPTEARKLCRDHKLHFVKLFKQLFGFDLRSCNAMAIAFANDQDKVEFQDQGWKESYYRLTKRIKDFSNDHDRCDSHTSAALHELIEQA